jgi:hypothetical protein
MWPETAVSQNVVSCCTYQLCVSSHVEILHNSNSDHVGVTLRLHVLLFDELVSDNN